MDENTPYRLILILENIPYGAESYQVKIDGRAWEVSDDEPILAINTEAGTHSIEVSAGRSLRHATSFGVPPGQNVTKIFIRPTTNSINIVVDNGTSSRANTNRGRTDREAVMRPAAAPAPARNGGGRALGMAAMLVLGLICGLLLSRAIWPSSTRPPAATGTPPETQAAESAAPADAEGGVYTVEIRGARRTADAAGDPAVVISYTWTNDGAESVNAADLFRAKAFQDGVQLDAAEIADVGLYDPTAYARELRPGATLELQAAFLLTSETAVVEFEVSPLPDVPGTPVLVEFDPAELE